MSDLAQEFNQDYTLKVEDGTVTLTENGAISRVFTVLTDEQIQDINDDVTHLLQKAKRRRGRRRSPDTDIILETLRKMAWAKAKAELESMLETYWSMGGELEDIETEILGFIERMEDRL